MKHILVVFMSVIFCMGSLYANEVVSDEKMSKISQRLEGYSADSLIERRDFLISYQEGDSEVDQNGVPVGTPSERAIEISIIEALLVVLGVVISDNISEDSSTPPDTVFPVITVLGNNPAIVELGSTYTDAGATSDGGESVTTSGTVDTNTVGTYTITYSATDAAGNTSTATRTVNVVDTTNPVLTIIGNNPVSVELGSSYTDAGATATDLDTVTVTSVSDVDTDNIGTYSVVYTATDASGNSSTATRTVNVVDTLGPTFTSSANFTAPEDQTSIGTVTATDPSGSVSFSISGTEITIGTTSGVLEFTSAANLVDFETKSSYSATVTASDGTNTSTQDITVTLTDVNEAPFIFTDSFNVDEDQTAVGTINASDPEGDTLTYSVSGSDFTIGSSSGVMAFAMAANLVDFETKSSYTVDVTVSDGTNSRTKTITVNLTDVNEAPFIFTDSFTVAENQTAVGTINATDPEGDTLTYSVSGSEFTIGSSSGVMAFVAAPDFETKSTFSVDVSVTDGTNSRTKTITVNVTDVDEEDDDDTSTGTGTGTGTGTSTGTGTGTGTST